MDEKIIIAVDAMGGDNSPNKVIDGITIALKKDKDNELFFNIYGDDRIISKLIAKTNIDNSKYKITHTEIFIKDNESPLQGAKKSKETSMWKTINSLKDGESHIALSAGNTGALLIISKMILEMIEGIDKPALAGLWPNKIGTNIVLDLGANIKCSEKNLIDFSFMGAALHKSLFPNEPADVAILNVGSEESKGHETLKNTYSKLKEINKKDFNFKGYVEGNDIMKGDINVVVTDGFTGNIALKTAEGTATFINSSLKDALYSSLISKFLTILNYKNFNKFKERLDPRKYNGAIFLGLNKPVVKSHGSTDSIGFAHSIIMCKNIIKGNLINKIKYNLSN